VLVTLSVLSSSMRRYFLSLCKGGLFQKLEMLHISLLCPLSSSPVLLHDVLFGIMQALGMKLLRKKDVPDYKVPSHIWG